MKPYNGGRRTRIRAKRADRNKRRFKSRTGEITPNGKSVVESMKRDSWDY
jgi:hypothetical protein